MKAEISLQHRIFGESRRWLWSSLRIPLQRIIWGWTGYVASWQLPSLPVFAWIVWVRHVACARPRGSLLIIDHTATTEDSNGHFASEPSIGPRTIPYVIPAWKTFFFVSWLSKHIGESINSSLMDFIWVIITLFDCAVSYQNRIRFLGTHMPQ
jgi:hypothetical protein